MVVDIHSNQDASTGWSTVTIDSEVLGPLASVLELVQEGSLVEAREAIKSRHPIPPMGKEMVVSALRALRSRRGGEWGEEEGPLVQEIRRELQRRPTIHIDIVGGNALLIELGREVDHDS